MLIFSDIWAKKDFLFFLENVDIYVEMGFAGKGCIQKLWRIVVWHECKNVEKY